MPAKDCAPILQVGLEHHRANRLREAYKKYQEVLTIYPKHFDALQLTATLLHQLGDNTAALPLFNQALEISKLNAAVFNNRGLALQELKRFDEAIASYDEAIRIKPEYAEPFNNRGNALQELKRFDEALASYNEAIRIKPEYAEAFNNRGTVLKELKRFVEALASYNEAIRIKPEYAEAFNNRGNALKELKRFDEALASYDEAIRIKPEYADAFNNRGIALQELMRFDQALASYDEAIRIKPEHADAFYNRAVALNELRRFEEALASYDEAIRIKPEYADAFNNRGIALKGLRRFEEALASYDAAIRIKPEYADAFINRGITLKELKRFDEALSNYDEAIRIKPEHVEAYWNKSLLLLLLGDFLEGWSLYEWRLKKDEMKNNYYKGSQRVWRGDWIINGKRILIDAEQGFGDSIQFVRYVKNISALGADVILRMPEPLISLFTASELPVTLIAKNDPLPNFDAYCPLLSLPYALKTSIETIPKPIPYLRADERKITEWQHRLSEEKRFRVGLVWSGSKGHKNDSNRSLALRQLLPLLDLPVAWYSLQKEYREEDEILLNDEPRIKRYEKELNDYSDTAALIAALDLVISVDTSVAHLAGAIGKRTWVLLPYDPDFRWMLDRNDSPWYPTVRLFRQDQTRNWDVALTHAISELHTMIENQTLIGH